MEGLFASLFFAATAIASVLAWRLRDLRRSLAELRDDERDRIFELSLDMMAVTTFEGAVKLINPAFAAATGWSHRELMTDNFLRFVHPEDRDATRAFFATARSIINERDADAIKARYRAIRQPVLLVWCRKDPIVPLRAGRQLAASLPQARLSVIEGCHHLPQHERPKQLLKVLAPFLGR